jgi:phosphatidylserine/phosphatidylglycerophosphate/cardiolipin synthase-like enzyme
MRAEEVQLLQSVAVAARRLPRGAIEELCDTLESLPTDPTARQRVALVGTVNSPAARALVSRLIEAWDSAPQVSSLSIAWSLRAASGVDDHYRRNQSVELVWTGPAPHGTTLRRTDQVLLDLIRTAERTLHVVTFAAYKIPLLRDAMRASARRGVKVILIFESPEASAGKTAFAGLEALGKEMRDLSSVYVWPLEKRPKDAAGHHGSLHAKCAIADETSLLVSSANLTEFALNMNMELGVLVRGGDLPGRVVDHLHQLMRDRVLVPLQ